MIGNTLPEYVLIRTSIALLRLVAPASFIYLAVCVFKRQYAILPLVLYADLEALFYVLVYLPRSYRLQAPPKYSPPPLTRPQRRQLYERCLASWGTTSLELPYPSGWFLSRHGKNPHREDVVDWLLWALFSAPRTPETYILYKEEIDEYVENLEGVLGTKLEAGYALDCSSMKVTLDPVLMLHRPLVWYFIVSLVDAYTSVWLLALGFRHYTPRETEWRLSFPLRPVLFFFSRKAPKGVVTPYWYRPHRSSDKHPVVFMHGIGIGLFPYIPFLRKLIRSQPRVGVLLPELLSISFRITPRSVPPRPLISSSMLTILRHLEAMEVEQALDPMRSESQESLVRQPLLPASASTLSKSVGSGWSQIVFVAHSYGTFVGGWFIRDLVDKSLSEAGTPDFAQPGPAAPKSSSSSSTTLTGKPTATVETLAASDVERPGNETFALRIAHMVLIDPIPILLSNPSVAHNFLYRHPSSVVSPPSMSEPAESGNSSHDADSLSAASPFSLSSTPRLTYSLASSWQLWYFASRDPDVARTLGRTFFWAEGGIWKDEIYAFLRQPTDAGYISQPHDASTSTRRFETRSPSRASSRPKPRNLAVVLGGQDQIIPADAIRAHLTNEERWVAHWTGTSKGESLKTAHPIDGEGILEVFFNPSVDHANIFEREEDYAPLLDVVSRYVQD